MLDDPSSPRPTPDAADALARSLATEEGLALARALQAAGVLAGHAEPAKEFEGPRPVLDWQPRGEPGSRVFERVGTRPCKPARVYADHPGVFRVCVFGESMAAGFPLAPSHSPSVVLEGVLRASVDAETRVEVLDLAAPNMGPSEQLRVAEAAQQFAPDVCVWMGGNNWYYGLTVEPTASPAARAEDAALLREGGPPALASRFRARLQERAAIMVEALVGYAERVQAEAIVVIPPANHAWQRSTPPPWLGVGEVQRWHEAEARAREALARGDLTAALEAAVTLQEIDATLTGASGQIRAQVLLAQGQHEAARAAAREALEACCWQNTSWALPQLAPSVAAIMRTSAREHGATCIDLEEVFAEHTGAPFLDFRMFYDQCHLSPEGIEVAMAALARPVLAQVSGVPIGSVAATHTLRALSPPPLRPVVASARVQAAHWYSQFHHDDSQHLESMLRAALDEVPEFREVFRAHIAVRDLACAADLNSVVPKAAGVPGVATSLFSGGLHAGFLAGILSALHAQDDPEVHDIFVAAVASYQRRFEKGLELAHPTFQPRVYERTPVAWHDPGERQGTPFCRSLWPTSRFHFLSDAGGDLGLAVVARIGETRPVGLTLNRNAVGTVELGPAWSRHPVRLPASALRNGLNRLTLHWPLDTIDEEAGLAAAIRRFRLGAPGDLFPCFGEIYSLRLTLRGGGRPSAGAGGVPRKAS